MIAKNFLKQNKAFTRLFFVQALVMGLTIFASANGLASTDCLDTKPAHHYGFCVAQKLHQLFNPKDKNAHKIEELSNGSFEIFNPKKSSHGSGKMHSEIYRIRKDGRNFLIKTMLPGSRGFRGQKNDKYFTSDLFGYLLASEIGGPEIGRAGRFKNSKGDIGYFIEMEELFSNDDTSTTFKGLERIKNFVKQKLGFRILTQNHLKNFAKLIVTALEHGIYLDDHDFIFSRKSDEVRWIDTTHWDILTMVDLKSEKHHLEDFDFDDENFVPWYLVPHKNELLSPADLFNPYGQYAVYHVAEMFNRMRPMHSAYTKELWQFLNIEISESKIWNNDQKTRMVKNLSWALSRFKWFKEENGYSCDFFLEP